MVLLGKYSLVLLAAAMLAGCQRQNEIQLTLVAQNATLQSEIDAVRQTATVDAERLQITVDYMATRVGQAEQSRVELQATLNARGIDSSGIANAAPLATPFPLPGVPNNNETNPVTPIPEQAVVPAESTQPALVDYVIAPGVGNNDCAINPRNTFTTSDAEIYVVATGVNIPAGTNIAARFAVAGQEVRHDFTPNFDIDGACVWFYIDQSDLEFRAGTWSVQLELNGTPASPPLPCTITGQDTMAEEAP
jgi:hypothetical protein